MEDRGYEDICDLGLQAQALVNETPFEVLGMRIAKRKYIIKP